MTTATLYSFVVAAAVAYAVADLALRRGWWWLAWTPVLAWLGLWKLVG